MYPTTLTFTQFCDAFHAAGRNGQFSYKAKRALYDFIEEMEEATGAPIELDVVALCCEYYESTWQEIANDCRIDLSECEDDEECIDAVRDYLEDNTMIVDELSDGVFVYAAF